MSKERYQVSDRSHDKIQEEYKEAIEADNKDAVAYLLKSNPQLVSANRLSSGGFDGLEYAVIHGKHEVLSVLCDAYINKQLGDYLHGARRLAIYRKNLRAIEVLFTDKEHLMDPFLGDHFLQHTPITLAASLQQQPLASYLTVLDDKVFYDHVFDKLLGLAKGFGVETQAEVLDHLQEYSKSYTISPHAEHVLRASELSRGSEQPQRHSTKTSKLSEKPQPPTKKRKTAPLSSQSSHISSTSKTVSTMRSGFEAIDRGDFDLVKQLINKTNVNEYNSLTDSTALMYAAGKGNLEMVKYFLRIGANHALQNNGVREDGGLCALAYAAKGGHVEVVKLLASRITQSTAYLISHALKYSNGNACIQKVLYSRIEDIARAPASSMFVKTTRSGRFRLSEQDGDAGIAQPSKLESSLSNKA
jgi:ankyrin repeat protein